MLVAGGLASLTILVSGFGFRAEAAPDDQIVIIINTGGEQKKPEAKQVTLRIIPDGAVLSEGKPITVLNKVAKVPGKGEVPVQDEKSLNIVKKLYKLAVQGDQETVSVRVQGDDLTELKDALAWLERLEKKGLLTRELIEKHITKALEQIKAKRIEGKLVEPKDGKSIRVIIDDGKSPGDGVIRLWDKEMQVKLTESKEKEGKVTIGATHGTIITSKPGSVGEIKTTVVGEKDGKLTIGPLHGTIITSGKNFKPEQKPRFGVNTEPISPAIAEHLKLPSNVGLLVTDVVADTPAAKVGIKVNDVLVKIGGAMVPINSEPFAKFVAGLKADTPLEVVVLRKGQTMIVGTVTLPGEAGDAKLRLYKESLDVKLRLHKKEDQKKVSGAETVAKALKFMFDEQRKDGTGKETAAKTLNAQWEKVQEDALKEQKKAEEALAFRLKKHEAAQAKTLLDAKVEKEALNKDAATITVTVKDNVLMIKQSEGALALTVSGVLKDGKVEVSAIEVQDDGQVRQYTSVAAVPEAHRGRVEELVKMLHRVTVKMDKE